MYAYYIFIISPFFLYRGFNVDVFFILYYYILTSIKGKQNIIFFFTLVYKREKKNVYNNINYNSFGFK